MKIFRSLSIEKFTLCYSPALIYFSLSKIVLFLSFLRNSIWSGVWWNLLLLHIFSRQICFEARMFAGTHLSIASEVVISNLKKISASSIYQSKMKNVCVFHAGTHVCARAALQAISKKLLHLRPLCATANKEVGHIVLAEVARLKKLAARTFSRVACLPACSGISNYLRRCMHWQRTQNTDESGQPGHQPAGSKMHDEPRCLTYCK